MSIDMNMELDKSLFKQFAKEMRSKNLTTDKDLSKIMQQMMKHVIEAMLDEEMQDHLGYPKYAPEGRGSGNSRNGTSKKTVRTEQSQLEVDIPRDRNASFEPKIVPKGQSRTGIMDDQIIALYAKGMSTREIGSMIKELYDVDISPSLISQVTERVSMAISI